MAIAVTRTSHGMHDAWQRFADSRAAVVLIFAWALAEATVFAIIADFLLAALLLVSVSRRRLLLGACIAGMALGGIVTVVVARLWPDFALDLLRDLPLSTEAHIAGAERRLAEHGAAGFLVQPVSGIPFKAWAVVAGRQELSPWLVVAVFIVARSARMALVGALAQLLRRTVRRWLRDWFALLAGAYVVLFTVAFVAVVVC